MFKKNIFNINQIKRELDQKSKTSSRSSQFGKLKKKKIQEIRKCEIRELIDSNLKSSVILNVCLMLTFKIFDFVCLVWFGLKKKKKKKKKIEKKKKKKKKKWKKTNFFFTSLFQTYCHNNSDSNSKKHCLNNKIQSKIFDSSIKFISYLFHFSTVELFSFFFNF